MRKLREWYVPGPLIFAAHAVVETADLKALFALVEHDIFQREFHRTPDRPAKDFLKRGRSRWLRGRSIKDEMEIFHGDKRMYPKSGSCRPMAGRLP